MSGEVFGRYRIEALLGRGGMGEVHRAFDTVRGRRVALKRLGGAVAADPEFRRRFRREAEAVSRLNEVHVVPIHDFGEIEGRLFIDMRLVEGADLATVLSWHGPLSPERAVRIVSQVARALDAAHRDGLVHRDVKPSNVLLAGATRVPEAGYEDYAYLVDFGIVHHAASTRLTSTGAAIGTAEYMAPERFTEGGSDRRGDVYALGCLLLEMLTGAVPFAGADVYALMWAHVNSPAPTVSARRPELGPVFDEVVAAALAKDPERRTSTAGEVAAAARAALAVHAEHGRAPAASSAVDVQVFGRGPAGPPVAAPTALSGASTLGAAPDTVVPDVLRAGGGIPRPAPGGGDRRRRRRGIAGGLAIVALVVLVVVVERMSTATGTPTADAAPSAAAVEETRLVWRNLPVYAVGDCENVAAGEVRCGEWTYTTAGSAGDAQQQVYDAGGGTANGYCSALRPGDAGTDQWRANGRGVVINCSLSDGSYRILGASDEVAVVVSASTTDVVAYERLLAEVQTVLARLEP